jgi:hypothetical protein
MSVAKKFHMSLDEARMLMLGGQILFGFQLQAVFRDGFEKLSPSLKAADAAGLLLMVVAMAVLVTAPAVHRVAYDGEITSHTRTITGRLITAALLPFGLSLGIDIFMVMQQIAGTAMAWTAAALLGAVALMAWYGAGFLYRTFVIRKERTMKRGTTPSLEQKIDDTLTEARLALPGAQTLLGFQLIVALSNSFEKLPAESKTVHAGALMCVALAMALLVAPAALHRVAFDGEDDDRFFRIAARLVSFALIPLMFGICGDVYVAITKILENGQMGSIAAGGAFVLLTGLWYVYPLTLRIGRGT